jgi:nucleoside-diphosphate-sugar epimerase
MKVLITAGAGFIGPHLAENREETDDDIFSTILIGAK